MSDNKKETWECPICGDQRYQKYGGTPVTGKNQDGIVTTVHYGRHFMCKGCSVFFSNPRLFNAEAVAIKQMQRANKIRERIGLERLTR